MKNFDVFLNGKYFDTLCFGSRKSVNQVLEDSTVKRLAQRGKVLVVPADLEV